MNPADQQYLDESPPVLPPRSRLFNLKPIGLGTPMVECLAGYIHRLSAAHGLPTWVLVCRELAPRFERKSMTGPNGYCDLFGRVGMTINGDNGTTLEMVAILQTLTGQTALRSLTFCRLGNLVAEQRILRRSQAWCPECLNQWRQDDQPVYQPLVWLLSQLSTCPIHGCSLQDRCSACGKPHFSLGRYRWSGHCPRCAAWLGKTTSIGNHPVPQTQSEWDGFSAGALARFVAAIQRLPDETPQTTFHTNVGNLVQTRGSGNFSALARLLRVRGFTVSCWVNGTQRPSPASLLAMAHCFGGEITDWLIGHIDFAVVHDSRPMAQSVANRIRRPLLRQPREDMRARLALVTQTPELPPPSFREVCRRLGFDQTVATRAFPDLATEIKTRYTRFLNDAKLTRELSRRTAIKTAVQQLLAEGVSLSYKHLRSVLPTDMSTRDKLLRTEFRRLQAELDGP